MQAERDIPRRMPAHVKSISSIASPSTHTALQLNQSQSPLLSCYLLCIHLNTENSINQQTVQLSVFFLVLSLLPPYLCLSFVNFFQLGIEKMKVNVDEFLRFLG